jgi:hypothetical protein
MYAWERPAAADGGDGLSDQPEEGTYAMSLQPQPAYLIPYETLRVAHAAFPKGALCLRSVEALGQLYHDEQFAALFPSRGQPAASPARLALAMVLQYVAGLSDRQRTSRRSGAAGCVDAIISVSPGHGSSMS